MRRRKLGGDRARPVTRRGKPTSAKNKRTRRRVMGGKAVKGGMSRTYNPVRRYRIA